MTIQESILTAKQRAQSSIPVYVVPDKPGGVKPSYGDELLGQAGPGNYQYGLGKSTYAPFAPGTKTLAAKQFDEEKRAQAVAEAINQQKLELDQAETAYALNKPYYKPSSGGTGSDDKALKQRSTDLANSIMQDMYDGYAKLGNKYNFQWNIDVARNKGVWDQMTSADQIKVMQKAMEFKSKKSEKDSSNDALAELLGVSKL